MDKSLRVLRYANYIPSAPSTPSALSCRSPFSTLTTDAFHGQKCIITGASRGIGHAISQTFAAAGASCVLVGRNTDTLEQCAAMLLRRAETESYEHLVRVGDVGDREFWVELGREMVNMNCLLEKME